MHYRIEMVNTVTDPVERRLRFCRLYQILTQKAGDITRQDEPSPADSAESESIQQDDCIISTAKGQKEGTG